MKDGQRIQYVDEHLWCFLKDIVGRGSDCSRQSRNWLL